MAFKNVFVRIFRKTSAKTGPQSLYLCGFPEPRVEMKVAPFRALTRFFNTNGISNSFKVEMKVAPFRALTHNHLLFVAPRKEAVEMKVAPFRALTQPLHIAGTYRC